MQGEKRLSIRKIAGYAQEKRFTWGFTLTLPGPMTVMPILPNVTGRLSPALCL
jgi:hypothetical protein